MLTLPMTGCDLFNQSTMKQFAGTYRLNIEESDLGPYAPDSNMYKDLILTIHEYKVYKFSKEVPFIFQREGSCDVVFSDIGRWCDLYYDVVRDTLLGTFTRSDRVFLDQKDNLILETPSYNSKINNKGLAPLLYFERVSKQDSDKEKE